MHWSLTSLENFARSERWVMDSARKAAAATDTAISPEPQADWAELEAVLCNEIEIDKLQLHASQQLERSTKQSEKGLIIKPQVSGCHGSSLDRTLINNPIIS